MSELKPCPFCGGEAQVNTWTMHGITESRCFCSNSDCPNSVRTVAFEQWNNRPIEDALEARIAELEESDKHWAGNVKVCMQLIERYESDIAENDALQARAEKAEARLIELGDVIKLQKL